jgi:hypothetical protein
MSAGERLAEVLSDHPDRGRKHGSGGGADG